MKESLTKYHMCDRKIAYKSRKSAENHLRSIGKTGQIIPSNAQAYKCPFSGINGPTHWHLGHKKGY